MIDQHSAIIDHVESVNRLEEETISIDQARCGKRAEEAQGKKPRNRGSLVTALFLSSEAIQQSDTRLSEADDDEERQSQYVGASRAPDG